MIIGIDGLSMVRGGGLSHLLNLVGAADSMRDGFKRLVVAGTPELLDNIPDAPWLSKVTLKRMSARYWLRLGIQYAVLPRIFQKHGCDVVLIANGTLPFFRSFPVVSISQNLLPFDPVERRRYGFSAMRLKLAILSRAQKRSFERADGLICLSSYAQSTLMRALSSKPPAVAVIPHGIEERFRAKPKPQLPITTYSRTRPFKLLYVSTVDVYKHQWLIADCIAELRHGGMPVTIDFVGPSYGPALSLLGERLNALDPQGSFMRYLGRIRYEDLHNVYHQADGFVFASTCENLPNILIEAMASGLPIACSSKPPMPDVLGDAGLYFSPEEPGSVRSAILTLLQSPEKRAAIAASAFSRAQAYSWVNCASSTFSFLRSIALCNNCGR